MAMIRRRMALAVLALWLASPARPRADEATRRFIEAAYSSAVFQAQISRIAAAKDTRPGIKALAERVRDFRASQLPELARLAGSVGVGVRDTLDLELSSIVENIEPLDYLALSRRYAEVEVQALRHEITAYEDAARSEAQPVREYAASTLERLRDLNNTAQAERAAVGP
jgi:putative membrane protein